MPRSTRKPALRPVETIVVPDPQHGRVLVLRDTEGISDAYASVPPALVPIVARFTGERTTEEIAREASQDLGVEVPVELVDKLAAELEAALFLHGSTYQEARARIAREFADASVRPASHAGGAYHADPGELTSYLEQACIAKANGSVARHANGKRIVGLIAPHIDPWRGALGYGHAYGTLRETLAPEVDTFVLFGTSHAPMREPFALCR